MEDCRELSECCRVTLRLPGLQGKCERQQKLPFLVFCGRGHQTALQQHTFCRPGKAKPPPGTLFSAQRIKLFTSRIKPFRTAQVQPVERLLFIGRDKAFLALLEQHPCPVFGIASA